MKKLNISTRSVLVLVMVSMLSACSWYRKVVPVPSIIDVVTTDQVNPDANDRPSPVVVKVFELADIAAFNNSEFFALFEETEATLAADALHQWEMTLRPESNKILEKILNEQTKYIGVVVAYRNLENARYKQVLAVDAKKKNTLRITIDELSVGISTQQ